MNTGSALKKAIKNGMLGLRWSVYGICIRNPVLPAEVRRILYVCKGNIVRSPFAERYSKRLLPEAGDGSHPLEFSSAGIISPETKKSPPEAVVTAKRFDVALDDHVPLLISHSLVEATDLVAVMDVWQFNTLKKLFPEHDGKIFLLPLFEAGGGGCAGKYRKYNILDPYGKEADQYDDCYCRMSGVIKNFLETVRPRTGGM